MPPDYVPDEPLHQAPKTSSKPASLFDMRKPHGTPEPKPETNRAKFGIYSDGTFCVQRDQGSIWLTPSETKELAEFLAKNT